MIIKIDLLSYFSFFTKGKDLTIHFYDPDDMSEHSESVDLAEFIKFLEAIKETK